MHTCNPGVNATVWNTYFFEKNLQGDVVAVYNESGTKLITYTYDAWGNFELAYCNGATQSTLYKKLTYKRDNISVRADLLSLCASDRYLPL